MGQVLLRFDRRVFLDQLDLSADDKQLLLRKVFLSTEWVQLDRGTLDEPEAELLMQARLPEHLHMNDSIFYHLDDLHTAIANDWRITFRYFYYKSITFIKGKK